MQRYHKFLFGLIMAVLVISPVAKVPIDIFDFSVMPLRGHVNYAEYPQLSKQNWFDGSFQKNYDKYLEDHIGLRNFFVRFHNQIDFSLYRKPSNKGIIVGKDDYLYEIDYIDAYLGNTFIGQDAIRNKCERIKAVQEELEKQDIELLIVLAPGKASMFPEFIPDRYGSDSASINNYEAYSKSFREQGIKHLDFNKLFRIMKDTSQYPLYHKCGIHWNTYGAYLALDSIVGYMEAKKNIDMVDMSYDGIEMSDVPRGTDYDVGDALNIFSRIPDQPMPYPYGYHYDTTDKVKPNLMVIADSYYWTIYNLHRSSSIWDEHDFRYYDVQLFSPDKPNKKLPNITYSELLKFDFIMIVYTEMNLHVLANQFLEKAYGILFQGKKLEDIKLNIKNDQAWVDRIQEKADRKEIGLEEQIHLEAMWILTHEMENESNTNNE